LVQKKITMEEKYKKFYLMFDKRFKNLILCSNLNSDSGIKKDFSVGREPHYDLY